MTVMQIKVSPMFFTIEQSVEMFKALDRINCSSEVWPQNTNVNFGAEGMGSLAGTANQT